MSTETKNKELIRQFVDEVWNEGNLDVIDGMVADDYIGHDPETLGGDTEGPEEFRGFVQASRTAFPDLELTFEDLIADGDKVCRRSRLLGTHDGEFMGIAPTGNTVDVEGMIIYRIENEQIAESWGLADVQGLMDQLGLA